MGAGVKVALIGCGGWGKNILRVLGEACVLVYDEDPETGATVSEIAPHAVQVRAFGEVLEWIRQGMVEAVCIATPPKSHYELARLVLEAGAHVFVEKPLCLEVGQAEALGELAEAQGRNLMVGHLLQYHPAFCKLAQMAAEGELGRLEYIYSHRLNLGKVRSWENVLWSFAPHDISMILSLANDRLPDQVYASGGAYLQDGIPDTTVTQLEWPDLRAHVFVSWLHPTKEQRLTVIGERGMVVFRDDKLGPTLLQYRYKVKPGERAPVPVREEPEVIPLPNIEPLAAEIRYFLDLCRGIVYPLTDATEGIRVLRVLEAAQSSLETGQAVRLANPEAGWWAHPLADVEEGAEIGAGTKVWRWSHVMAGARIGAGCMIGQGCHIGPGVVIGDGCRIQNGVSLYEGLTLGDYVFVGPNAVFTNVRKPKAGERGTFERTWIGDGAIIGANATIRCGVEVGAGAFVGAGAVVTRNVEPGALVLGVPAREVERD